MRPGRTSAVVSAIAIGALGSLVPAPAAVADTSLFTDRSGDAPPGLDIERVRVGNGARIVVSVSFDNIKRDSGNGLVVYFDTRGPDRGPEYLTTGGLGATRDWQALRIENWRGDDARLLHRCDIDMRVNHVRDKATFDLSRRCFHRPGRVRVAARSRGMSNDDWAPRVRRFYDWVSR